MELIKKYLKNLIYIKITEIYYESKITDDYIENISLEHAYQFLVYYGIISEELEEELSKFFQDSNYYDIITIWNELSALKRKYKT